MIARLMRSLWIAALCVAGLVAWGSIHWLGGRIGPWAAGLLGVLVVVSVHPLLIGFQFFVSRLAGDPVPAAFRLTPWQAVKTYDAEIDASMRGLWFGTPFLAHRPAPRPTGEVALRDTPVLFIHGYLCNRAVWLTMIEHAAARGHLCEAVTLPNPFASIESQVPTIARAIDDLLAEAHAAGLAATRVALVGHSMGGLVARAALAELGPARIASVITLGTPHHGTHAARLGRIPSVVQMRRSGRWLADLATREASLACPTRFTTLFSWHDDIVYPQTTGTLSGATQVAIGGCGHVALLYDRRVRSIVLESLEARVDQAASEGLSAS